MATEQCVVLLHGLARTERSMEPMARALADTGMQVANVRYPSRDHPIEELAPLAIEDGVSKCQTKAQKPVRLHFVTHSLGGILVRQYLSGKQIRSLGRVVMIAPPNQGSEVVDALRNVPGYYQLNGPAGMQLGTGKDSVPRKLGPVTYPVGIVAGTRSVNLILSNWLPNPDDGKVSVKSTMVEGMTDFIAVPSSHPFIMRDKRVIEQTIHFLKSGKFARRRKGN